MTRKNPSLDEALWPLSMSPGKLPQGFTEGILAVVRARANLDLGSDPRSSGKGVEGGYGPGAPWH